MAKFTVTGSDLHEATSWTSRIVPARPVVPTLGGLLLAADEDTVAVRAFDFDTAGTATLPAIVAEPGRALVSGRLLAAIAKTVARDVDVTIETDGPTVVARCGRSEWLLPGMDDRDFPELPALGEQAAEVEAEDLRHALGRVLPAVHRGGENVLANLTGVKLDGGPEGLRVAATDRYRVGVARVAWKSEGDAALDALVPGELLDVVARTSGSERLRLAWDERTFGVAADRFEVVGRQIAESYPNLDRVLPRPGEHFVVIEVADLARAVDEAMVMLDREPAVQLAIDADGIEVAVLGDERRARAHADILALEGESTSLAVNAGYLRTCLQLVESEAAVLHLGSRTILALPSDRDGTAIEGYEHVVMLTKGKP